MKVYIAFIDKGSWDSHIRYVDKVFMNKDAADAYAVRVNENVAKIKSELPVETDDDSDEETVAQRKAKNDAFVKLVNKFKDEDLDYWDIVEFNECTVQEFELE